MTNKNQKQENKKSSSDQITTTTTIKNSIDDKTVENKKNVENNKIDNRNESLNKIEDKFKEIKAGDQISLKYKITETTMEKSHFKAKAKAKTKERMQSVDGLVIARKHGSGVNGTITIRSQIEGIGTERIFPVCSPLISDVIKKTRYKVRRSKLYYLRNLSGRAAKLKKL